MKNDQPALLQQYIRLRNQSVGLRSMVDHERGAGVVRSRRPLPISERSASFTAGSDSGGSRKRRQKPPSHKAPKTLINRKPERHPNGYAKVIIIKGATAPPQRAKSQMKPCVRPRSSNGNHSREARL